MGVPGHYRDFFVARRNGEVFLYMNDAVIGLPFLSDYFYTNNILKSGNRGKAKISIRLCDSERC